jgi:hypothetical protein
MCTIPPVLTMNIYIYICTSPVGLQRINEFQKILRINSDYSLKKFSHLISVNETRFFPLRWALNVQILFGCAAAYFTAVVFFSTSERLTFSSINLYQNDKQALSENYCIRNLIVICSHNCSVSLLPFYLLCLIYLASRIIAN